MLFLSLFQFSGHALPKGQGQKVSSELSWLELEQN